MTKAVHDYDWKRFWLPPDRALSLDDGFTPDPEDWFGRVANPELRSFDELAEYRLLILIGEPGIGKSRALADAAAFTESDLLKEGDEALLVDMSDTISEDRLRGLIFGSEEFERWKDGEHQLHLFLDSLDEAQAAITKIKKLLLAGLKDASFNRLFLRIACRTADRLEGLEDALKQAFGSHTSAAYELVPLRIRDVQHAAEKNGLVVGAFLKEIIDRGLQPLATKPITLALLFEIYKSQGDFPEQNADVYEKGCRTLCQEPRDDTVKRASPPDLLLRVAARMAAATVLGGRTLIALDEVAPGENSASTADFLSADDVAGDPPLQREQVEKLVREVIGTSLFSARGNDHVGWYHQTVAEYLAARYLNDHGLDVPALARLLMREIEGTFSSTPQLAEVVKWLAQLNEEFREFVLSHCPTALVGGDMRYLTDRERQVVVRAVFADVEAQAVDTWDRTFFRSLKHLGNEALSSQIQAVIEDRTLHPETHEIALRLLADCDLPDLSDFCVEIALDASWPVGTRTAALYAIGDIGTPEARARVAPLALDPPEEDHEDELKGTALRAVFPSAISAAEMFGAITPAKNRRLLGAYGSFLHRSVAPNLSDEDVRIALEWVDTLDPEVDSLTNEGSLSDDILLRAFELPPEHSAWSLITTIVVNRLNKCREVVSLGFPRDEKELSEEARRKIVVSLIEVIRDGSLTPSGLSMGTPVLLQPSDVAWAIEKLREAVGSEEELAWAQIVSTVTHPNSNPAEYLLADDISDIFHDLTEQLRRFDLGSGIEDVMRKRYEEKERGGPEAPSEFGSAEENMQLVTGRVEAFEEGDPSAWWQLGQMLTTAYRKNIPVRHGADVFSRIYEHAPPELQTRLIAASKSYLLQQDPEVEQWIGTNSVNYSAIAGYQSIRLLLEVEPDWFDKDGAGNLEKWAHVIIWWPSGDDEESEVHRTLVRRAFSENPDVVARAFSDITKGNLKTAVAYPFPLNRAIDDLDFTPFESELIDAIDSEDGTEEQKANLLEYMVSHRSIAATDRAVELVASAKETQDGTIERTRAVYAASILVRNDLPDAWPVVADAAHNDVEFGKTLALYVAGRRDSVAWALLNEQQASALFEWLETHFPTSEDPEWGDQVTGRHEIARLRNGTLQGLALKGSESAVAEIKRLEAALPHLDFLPRQRHIAIKAQMRQEWDPPSPKQIIELCRDASRRYVTSEADLQEVTRCSLERLQKKIATTTEADDFWNTSPEVKPKAENEISEKIKRWLDQDLKDRGIIVNREVTVRTLPGGKNGERMDVKIEAVTQDGETVTLIIEVKGCWNRDIPQSIEDQLVDEYMGPNGLRYGIFLVAWFGSEQWTDCDRRKNIGRCSGELDELAEEIEGEAAAVSERRAVSIETVVLDLKLR